MLAILLGWIGASQAGLQMHLRLDETSGTTAADASGQGHTGQRCNSATCPDAAGPTVNQTGRIYQAYDFDNATDSVTIADFAYGSAGFSVAAWARADTFGTDDTIVSQGNFSGGFTDFAFLLKHNSTSGPSFALSTGGTGTTFVETTAGTSMGTGAWHHIAGTYDNDALRLYVDGALVDTDTTPTGAVFNSTLSILVGSFFINSTRADFWDGLIDDVRLYDHVLSAAEVLRLYTRGRAAR